MAIETTCGGCGKLLSVGDENAGRRARCPACGQIYTIPTPSVGFSGNSLQGAGPPDLPTQPLSPQPRNDLFAETTAGASAGISDTPNSTPSSAENAAQFWMRTTEGAEYGPADRATLNRWFNEGRVGPGYMIRQSETGIWEAAEIFRPIAQQGRIPNIPNSANPYANVATGTSIPPYGQMYPKSDQSGIVLAFGILTWFMFCPIFGVVAWIMGHSGLHDIRLGLVDPANKGLMQAGYYLGMVNVILWMLCGGGYFVFIALALLGGAMN